MNAYPKTLSRGKKGVHIDNLSTLDYTQGVLIPWGNEQNSDGTGDSDVPPDETTTVDPLLADWLGEQDELEWGEAALERYFYD